MTRNRWLLLALPAALAAAALTARAAPSQAKPEDAQKIADRLKAPKGFNISLFASPPDISYPTSVSAAPTGELYVAIDEQGSLGKTPGGGRVVRCVDKDGDGRADDFTIFAKMEHPRGVIWDPAAKALYVLHPPFLSVYHDTNGDGVADKSEVLISGISTEASVKARGADHTTNGIRLGIDGWIYIAMGDFGALKAVAKDGTVFQKHGGGVVRVRPDGTGIESYSYGQRNIYDVAIDPLMNVFTRDNTNDGDGWNDRLSHVVPSGNYGYPSLFKHFPGEFIDCLNDYGGGSPCGSLFVSEPGLPGDFGNSLYTVEWGSNAVFRHPLTPQGAGYKTPVAQEKFIDVQRGTDMDVDGSSRFYLSSWVGASFNRVPGDNVGYVARLAPADYKAPAFPDLVKTTDDDLVKHLSSPSGVLRQAAQRYLVTRGDKPAVAKGLEALAASDAPLPSRAAAVFTLKLLRGAKADAALAELTKKDDLREIALRALADKPGDKTVPAKPFTDALADANPRVRLIAAWGLGRLGKAEAAPALVPLAGDADFLVAHVATNSLVALNAADAALKALDPSTPKLAPGALRALMRMHEPAAVDGLIARLPKIQDPATRVGAYKALARLFYKEADWDGSWWNTRPDTAGPYFKTAAWNGSPKIKAALGAALKSEKPDVLGAVLVEVQKNKIDLPEADPLVAKLAQTDVGFRDLLVGMLADRSALTADQVGLLKSVAVSDKETPQLRAKAVRALTRNIGGARGGANKPVLDAAVDALAAVVADPKAAPELSATVDEFVRDPRHAQNVDAFTALAASNAPAKQELGYSVLVSVANSRIGRNAAAKTVATKAVEKGWEKPATAAPLLRAVGRTKTDGYKDWVEAMATDKNADVVRAAAFAADRLGLKHNGPAAETRDLIETLGYDKTLALVLKEKGDPVLGKELFTKVGCVACHTVSQDEQPKGPFLGGISTRYSRTEIGESIMKPNAKIAQGFETQWFKNKEGDVVEGFVTRDAGDEIEYRNVAGVTAILKKADIDARGKRDTSIMPEGLVAKLTPQDLASLVAYLETLKAK